MVAISACVLLVVFSQITDSRISKRATTPVQLDPNRAVKLFHQSQWGYICANKWNSNDAKVICRMLGYWSGSGVASVVSAPSNVYLLDNVVCGGTEADISLCHYDGWSIADCPLLAVAGVDCTSTAKVPVRLSGGFGAWEGRLEIYSGGLWHPVCARQWDDKDAAVVCRSLGLSQSGGTAHADGKYGRTSSPPIITNVVCLGSETDITRCKASESVTDSSCTQAGVECYNCGDEYNTVTGTVQSANFPNSYPAYQHCLYIIRPPDNGELYKLEFPSFKTEQCCDMLQVTLLTNNSNYPEAGHVYSGDSQPPMLLGKAFGILFNTDGSSSFTGFQAKWSPARVEDLVVITCDSGSFKITVDLLTLKRLYPQSSEKSIALADPKCTGSMTVDDKLVITSATDACGTLITTTSTTATYSNFLVDRVFAPSSSMIVRQERWKIPIKCEVPRDKSFILHYNPYANSKRRIDDLNHNRREVKGQIHQEHPFPVQMEVFADKEMTTRLYTSSVTRDLGDNLFLRVDLPQADSDLILVLRDCFARPSPLTTAQTYYIIRNGCEVDSQTLILRRTPHYTDLQIKVFEFAGNYPRVYITCDVRVCPNSDHSSLCDQSCATNPRRSRDDADTRNQMRLTFGPVIVDN